MDKTEALNVLEAKLSEYRGRTYAELRSLIGRDEYVEVKGPSGAEYQIEIQIFWDHKHGGIRVSGGIDDGGLRAFVPPCRDFLVSPDERLC